MTANTHDVPEFHNGATAFTFELRFSEAPASGFGYTTVRNHAFAVTGGSVSKVRRLEPGKNVRWEATVTPDSNVGVTIALHPTIDCSVQCAICTSDSGMLSGGLEMAVSGPSSQQSVQENLAPTGAPTSSGTTQVGETLTASTSGNFDSDGLTNASFTYQWLADENGLEKVTVSFAWYGDYSVQKNEGRLLVFTFTTEYEVHWLVAGMKTAVRVCCADDAGNDERLTSALTEVVRGLLAGFTLVDTSDQSASMLPCRNVTIRSNSQSPIVKATSLNLCTDRHERP